MKNIAYPAVFACLCAWLWAQEPAKPEQKFAWATEEDPMTATVRSAGDKLIDRIGGSLLVEVERVLATKGLDEAVELLHLKSLNPPKPVPGKPRVSAIKLTSLRIRAAKNTPDEADLAALDLVRIALNNGEAPPKIVVQKVDAPDTPTEWRVYRPIAVSPKCLLCHGSSDSLQPQVLRMLERLYPEDRANGYSAWEWRGLIRVSYEAPTAVAAAKSN